MSIYLIRLYLLRYAARSKVKGINFKIYIFVQIIYRINRRLFLVVE